MANLYIVGTPIGNLEDISLRALRILKEVDLILCEDTRVTKRLLDYYQIRICLLSYHQHSKIKKIDYILNLLKKGKNLALLSDAGTPCISDPGSQLINAIISCLPETKIIPVPGPSALITAASISGFAMDKFLFLGFPPSKRKRDKFFEEIFIQIKKSKYPVIFYESCHRIIKSLEEMSLKDKKYGLNPTVVVCRELTKQFETIYRGSLEQTIKKIKLNPIKGEFVVILGKK